MQRAYCFDIIRLSIIADLKLHFPVKRHLRTETRRNRRKTSLSGFEIYTTNYVRWTRLIWYNHRDEKNSGFNGGKIERT